jgi:hypothetical protein
MEARQMNEVVTQAEREEIIGISQPIVTAARALSVNTHAEYAKAGESLKEIKGAMKRLAEKKALVLNPALDTVKRIRDLFRGPEEELALAENLHKRALIAFDDEQEQIRRREQARLDDIARRDRETKEAAAKKLRDDAEAARLAGDEKKAERLETRAEVKQDQAATVVAAVAQTEPPRVSGTSIRENWSAVVTDKAALIAAVAAGVVPEMALEPNSKFLNNQAKAMKRELRYPGVTATVEKIMASRGT